MLSMEMPRDEKEWEKTFCNRFAQDEESRDDLRTIAGRLYQLSNNPPDSERVFHEGDLCLDLLHKYNGVADAVISYLKKTGCCKPNFYGHISYLGTEVIRFEKARAAERAAQRAAQRTGREAPRLETAAAVA